MLQSLQIPQWDAPHSDVPFSNINAINTHNDDSDAYSTDHFRMFEFKVRNCPRGRSHDWTECPYAHPAEKARRRDPRKYNYSGAACPDFRKGHCRKGDTCEFAHGVFECWLHPSRYRTQLCKDGAACRRRICFFAHAPEQLRVLTPRSAEPHSIDSPIRNNNNNNCALVSSPTSVLNYSSYLSSESPPSSPGYGVVPFSTVGSVRELVTSMRNVQLDEAVGSGSGSGSGYCVFGSRRGLSVRAGLMGLGSMSGNEEELPMQRVESGRDIRARMYAKLSRENSSIGRNDGPTPDIGWVSELVK